MRCLILLLTAVLGACSPPAKSLSFDPSLPSEVSQARAAGIGPPSSVEAAMNKIRSVAPASAKAIKFDAVRESPEASYIVCGYVDIQAQGATHFQPFVVHTNSNEVRVRGLPRPGLSPSEQENHLTFGEEWRRWCGRPLLS